MKKITFYPKNNLVKEIIPPPKPVQIPEWFKKIPIYTNRDNNLFVSNGEPNYSVKTCMPFLDSFLSGYTIDLWCDIQIRYENDLPLITWGNINDELSPVLHRPNDAGLPVQDGFFPFIFSWISHWGIKTPKGYSSLFTHPLNRTDLPFITTSGIMDTDGWGIWGNQPFALKKDWEGVLPAGTPIVQILPFKRDNWKSSIDDSLTNWAVHENIRRSSKFRGYYKSKYWVKKVFK
jgi:hypothetical protein